MRKFIAAVGIAALIGVGLCSTSDNEKSVQAQSKREEKVQLTKNKKKYLTWQPPITATPSVSEFELQERVTALCDEDRTYGAYNKVAQLTGDLNTQINYHLNARQYTQAALLSIEFGDTDFARTLLDEGHIYWERGQARVYEKLGEYENALATYQKIDHATKIEQLELLFKMGETERARALISKTDPYDWMTGPHYELFETCDTHFHGEDINNCLFEDFPVHLQNKRMTALTPAQKRKKDALTSHISGVEVRAKVNHDFNEEYHTIGRRETNRALRYLSGSLTALEQGEHGLATLFLGQALSSNAPEHIYPRYTLAFIYSSLGHTGTALAICENLPWGTSGQCNCAYNALLPHADK